MCEENSAVARQTSVAAERLNDMAAALRADAGRFRV